MMKRMLSFLLCLIMLVSLAAPSVQANDTSDDIYVEEGSSVTEVPEGTEAPTEPSTTAPTEPQQEELPPVEGSPLAVPTVPGEDSCDCGTEAEDLFAHSDSCAVKQRCIALCAGSAIDLYTGWYSFDVAERVFIREYLAQHYPETMTQLQRILDGDQIADENDSSIVTDAPVLPEELQGEATAQVGDITVDAVGIPEGSSLTVEDASKKATAAVEEKVEELGENPEQLFLYDISVQNEESDDWQPEGTSVRMELTLPDVKLHKHATVYVIHVDDEGNTSTIEARVNEEGAIVFDTEGFSTFGGFTVDFEYGSAFYSIQGLSSVTLSELFDQMTMPLYASDVADVTFTDYSLISVTRLEEENDWLLTSLKAFRTKEDLTITMKDGTVYQIRVTDAQPDIIVGGGGFDGVDEDYRDYNDNNEVVWNADGDGHLDTQYYPNIYHNDGWSKTSAIYIGGTGTFYIQIDAYSNVVSNSTAYIRIHQIHVMKGVNLIVRLVDNIDNTSLTTVQLLSTYGSNMFWVKDGAHLKIQGRAKTSTKAACHLILDGDGQFKNTEDKQLIYLDSGARGLYCNYVRFQNAPRSAIMVVNTYGKGHEKSVQEFKLNQCIFDNTVRRESSTNTGSGGAIYVAGAIGNNYVWMDEFGLSNCTFNGCYAAESGGAIGIYGKVGNIHMTNCTFNGTYAKKNYGGAIVMAGHAGKMSLTNCKFYNVSAPVAGGALYVVSRVLLAANNTYSRLNQLTISGCTFKNDSYTSISNGQTINSALGGAMSLDTSIHTLSISGCTFENLRATEGAGICFGYTNFAVKTPNDEYAFMSNDDFDTEANATKAPPDSNNDGSTYYRTTIGATTISNCDFKKVKADTQGGGIRFRTNSVVKSISMDDVNFDGCEAIQAGSAIMLGDTIIPTLTYTNSTIQNCATTMDSSAEVGGSFRTIGKTTCNATLTNIKFINNTSHCSGGGVYWNAAGVRRIWAGSPITTQIALNQCTFDGNKAGWYGGGIFCESVMTVTGCELKNNVSVLMGGGIALQLYNNTVRPFTDGEVTNLQLDSATNIHHNQSKVGGGISIRANASQALDNSTAHGHTIQFVLGGAQVHHNYATTDGGGVWFNVDNYDTSTEAGAGDQQEVERFNKSINLNSGSVYSNTAGGNGGGIFMNGGRVTDPTNTATTGLDRNGTVSITVSGAAVYDNEAGRAVTGVTTSAEGVLPPTFSITKGSDGNIAFTKAGATGGNGGGIYMSGNTGVCYITGGVIGATKNADGTPGTASKNIATRSTDITVGGNGGGIAIFGEGRIEMEGGYVVNNTSDTAGGGIAVHDSSSMYLSGGTIKQNQSHMGGGISLNAAKPYKADSTLDKEKYGIYLNGGVVEANRATPDSGRGNIAYGGGICISAQSTAKINAGLIKGNYVSTDTTATTAYAANQEGGGIAVCEASNVTFAGGTVEGNYAYDGGGMAVRGASVVTMSGSLSISDYVVNETTASGVIKKNYAYNHGGGIYIGPYKGSSINTVTMTDGWIYDNEADNGSGGGVHVTRYNGFYLEGGYIDKNTAKVNGGAIYVYHGGIEISDGVIQNNEAKSGNGGAVYSDTTTITITNGVIQGNTATVGSGGGIYFISDTGKSKLLSFSGTATAYGKLLNNTANGSGGAICAARSEITITNGLFESNSCTTGDGGAIYADQTAITISNGEIKNNTATAGNGGGIFFANVGGTTTKTLTMTGTATTYGKLLNNTAYVSGGAIYANEAAVTITNGLIQNCVSETGNGGGGAIYARKTTVTVSNGVIQDNTALKGHGGGIHMRYGTLIFSGTASAAGQLLNNKAPAGCGGGIYGNKTDQVDIDYMKAEGNSAVYGGAVYLEYCANTTIDGGVFTKNYSNQGAGMFIRAGQSTITGGEFTYNVAGTPAKNADGTDLYANDNNKHGGGIVIDAYSTTAGEYWVKIQGGLISHNEAPYGGGISIKNISGAGGSPDVTMTGGEITYNTATDGGGVFIHGKNHRATDDVTTFVIKGGDISYNTADGKGGGVYATHLADVQILADTDTDTHGTVSNNNAASGGGIAVVYGATLEVKDGYITYNTATTPANPSQTPATTGYQHFGSVYGAGGGIFVARGNSDSQPSTFKLYGDNMAIYGNTATFAADDVFSSGENTKLDMPLVKDMNLAGYGFRPEGWFEDYNPGDANYKASTATGLNMLSANAAPSGVTVERYRNATATQRKYAHIKPDNGGKNYVRGNMDTSGAAEASYNYASKLNAYVCMTLGIPAAADDVIVYDYAGTVTINVWENDLFMEVDDFKITKDSNGEYTVLHTYVGNNMPTDVQSKDNVYYTTAKPVTENAFYGTFRGSNHGKVSNKNNGTITFTPEKLIHHKATSFIYTVEHNTVWYYARVRLIPATTIYFEDTLDDRNKKPLIKYHTNEDVGTYEDDEGDTVPYDCLATWKTATDGTVISTQDQDRAGDAGLESLDKNNVYGFDSNYDNVTSLYSGNRIHYVDVSRHDSVDADWDGKCDVEGCGKKVRHLWKDTNSDGKCDVCQFNGATHHCTDTDGDGKCEVAGCLVDHPTCVDTTVKDGLCDLCGRDMGTHTINARVTFTFAGTGCDIIGYCSARTGIVMANVYDVLNEDGTGYGEIDFDNPDFSKLRATYMVDTHFSGITLPNGNKVTALRQAPILQIDMTKVMTQMDDPNTPDKDESVYEDYGWSVYAVELYIAPSFLEREAGYWSSRFCLDAIRVYNPTGIGGSNSSVAQSAYKKDGEGWPVYTELRDMFIDQKELGTSTTTGVLFIDGQNDPTLADYIAWGPNNEVYLSAGQSVAFTLDATNYDQNVASVQIGVRSLVNTSNVTIQSKGANQGYTLSILNNKTIGTTDMYYQIGSRPNTTSGTLNIANHVVTITNSGANPIAITNIKVTHWKKPTANANSKMMFKSNARTAEVALDILNAEQLSEPAVTPKYPALSFNGMICYNVFFTADGIEQMTPDKLGLAVFDSYEPEGTVETAKDVIMGATEVDGLFMVATNGVNAKYLGDTQYFRAFAKQTDGSYVYSPMVSYSALDYAKNVLSKSNDPKLKQLVVAMLNYGAEAQKFFGYKTDDLMNKDLTAEDQALLEGIDVSSLNSVGTVDPAKVGAFASTGGFTRRSPAISFNGAFEINYFFTPANALDGDFMLYFWSEDTYNSVTELTAENADKVVELVQKNGSYTAVSDEIIARELDKTLYVAAVYQSGGETYCSGVLPYSIAAYCQKPPADVQALATAAGIYGCTAKQYFGE